MFTNNIIFEYLYGVVQDANNGEYSGLVRLVRSLVESLLVIGLMVEFSAYTLTKLSPLFKYGAALDAWLINHKNKHSTRASMLFLLCLMLLGIHTLEAALRW